MKWQMGATILALILAGAGYVGWQNVFNVIDELAGTEVTYYFSDDRCSDCNIIQINTSYWEYCFEHSEREDVLYKKSTRGRRLWFNLNKIGLGKVDSYVSSYGKTIRPLKDGDCIKRYTKKNPRAGKIYLKSEESNNINEGYLVTWSVPIGDRNFEEYGRCRKYEIEKGVCKETNLLMGELT